ncbi:hypothetical protein [Nocardia cyriacigeorgica]|uniref:hypothetical protein n=1 Tax=Nocardia cyriacigeorgica TaxID=135487 RepID=UPI002454D1F2|nr:hypothetical protein [Nocardia cyriacigeorgica]
MNTRHPRFVAVPGIRRLGQATLPVSGANNPGSPTHNPDTPAGAAAGGAVTSGTGTLVATVHPKPGAVTKHDHTSPAGALTVPSNGAPAPPGVTDGAAAASPMAEIIRGAAKAVATATRFIVVFMVISSVPAPVPPGE